MPTCIHCGDSFKTSSQLKDHLEIRHKGDANSPARCCRWCGVVFAKLEQHVQAEHVNPPPVFKCRVCKMSFLSPGRRNNHEATQHNAKECEEHGLVRME